MKTVIFAGGLGTRLSEETSTLPKPMVHIGNYPMLWHIMKIYDAFDLKDFVLALGYKGQMIKQYFYEFSIINHDFHINTKTQNLNIYRNKSTEDWNVSCIDTGEKTLTAGRLQLLQPYLEDEDIFCLTYGDGLAELNIQDIIAFHKKHGKLATVTLVKSVGRFGIADLADDKMTVLDFKEKPDSNAWINGGFFVLSKKIFDYIPKDAHDLAFEQGPLQDLVNDHQLVGYKHHGFWQCMDTLRDKMYLNSLWDRNQAPWKIWK